LAPVGGRTQGWPGRQAITLGFAPGSLVHCRALGRLVREPNHRTATPHFFKLQEAGRAPGLLCSVLQSGLFSLGLQPSPKRRPKGCPAQVLGEPAPCSILLDRPPRSPLLPDSNGFPVPQMLERRQALRQLLAAGRGRSEPGLCPQPERSWGHHLLSPVQRRPPPPTAHRLLRIREP